MKNKVDIIKEAYRKLRINDRTITYQKVYDSINEALTIIEDTLSSGEEVNICRIGALYPSKIGRKLFMNFQKKEMQNYTKAFTVRFKPSQILKKRVTKE